MILLTPAADTTLIQTTPDNNLGGQPFFNAGTTQNLTKNRGLFRFDLAGQIPARSRIKRVTVLLAVTRQPSDGFAPSAFGLHRVLQSWGEGDKTQADPRSPGLGVAATTNEATWNNRFALTANTWTLPGGMAEADYAAAPSAMQVIYDMGNSPYLFGPTPQLQADVQSWLDDPQANFGWMLISQAESEPFTARRFGSREDVDNAPLLEVEFAPPLHIERVEIKGTQFLLQFVAQAGEAYVVEVRSSLEAGTWQTLSQLDAPQEISTLTVSNTVSGPQRFYRIRAVE
ncbi:MAG: DNRLRE domain-containing protein [Chloroflexi bacterium]|nr:DNRLRE domain-containing protein [Chloroflexota bacterium]